MCPLTACTLNLNQVVSARGSSVGGIRALLQHLFPPSLFFSPSLLPALISRGFPCFETLHQSPTYRTKKLHSH